MNVPFVKMADEAFATGKMPTGYRAMAGYLFSKAAYHPWTAADWAKFGKVKKLPIYVPAEGIGQKSDPVTDAFACLNQLYVLGVPKGSAVALDMETNVFPVYVAGFRHALVWGGYRLWVYGSASTVFGNGPWDYWVADYAGKGPFMFNHAGVKATQYASGPSFDSSVVKWWQYVNRIKVW